jgi:hypothetical protein
MNAYETNEHFETLTEQGREDINEHGTLIAHVRTIEQIRDEFESAAHSGYVSAGIADTDGYYAPEPKSSTVTDLRRSVPITPAYFRYGNDFTPTQEQLTEYNETFYVGPDYKPDHLDLAVQWKNGWKTYRVTGTRHAAAMLRKFAGYNGFQGARLNAPLHREDGYLIQNVIRFDRDDITGSDRFGKYRGLTDRNNAQYDLSV